MTAKRCFTLLFLALLGSCSQGQIAEIKTDGAPKAMGPFSQAVRAGHYLFVAGQISVDLTTGELVGDTIEEQTTRVLDYIEAILKAQGLTLANVVKTGVSLKDMNDFEKMNGVYAERFTFPIKPARHTVQVGKLALDALIEIDCTAYIP